MLRVIHKGSNLSLDKDPIYKAGLRESFLAAHSKRIKWLKETGRHYTCKSNQPKVNNNGN